jgi:hypothetical protein
MKLRNLWPAAVAAVALGVGTVGGSALAGSAAPNTAPGARPAASAPQFAAGREIGVKGAAVITRNGTVARASTLPFAVTSAKRIAIGQYEVVWNKKVGGCAYEATIGLAGSEGTEEPGEITVVRRVGDPNGVFISTHDSSGAYANRGFHLIVIC